MASRLQDVILRGPASSKPAATVVAAGTLYYSTDTFLTDRSNGTIWESYADGGSGGAVAAHAATHASGGSDSVTVTTLAGYTGNASDVLRGNATFGASPAVPQDTVIGCQWDGGGAVPVVGVTRYLEVPFAHTITAAIMLADVPGSAVVDVWRDTYVNAPPTVADTICASAKPTLFVAIKNKDTVLAGWSKIGAAGDVYGFKLDSASVLTFVRVSLTVTRT